ncbi:hypothetical protein [Anderseniella sp. Alg231-50]|uniref:hypothetical protein n=1 Tax=Anderseniella sp. Alg231-50 TaxID=1922226 RepID=UPI000D54F79A
MVLNRLLDRLQLHHTGHDRANEFGQLGFMEWLGSLPADSDYYHQAMTAYQKALPLRLTAPAIGVFCDLLIASTRMPPQPLDLSLPSPHRRGGARGRRMLH